jgi:peptide/nickel transport system substrate-binding protein
MRRKAFGLLVAAVMLTAASCGDDDDSSTASVTASTDAAAETTATPDSDQSDAVIRFGVNALPAAKGNPFNSVGSPGIYTLAAIYDPITFVSSDGTVAPWLATEWERTSDTTWNFTLRDDVMFSNGEMLDAEGLASVINFLVTDEVAATSAVARDVRVIESAVALDEFTLEVTTSVPDPILPNKMTEIYVPAPGVIAEGGIDAITENPVGTGPFMVTEWGATDVTLAAFTDSWRAPLVSGLKIQALPEPAARVQALQSGQVDLVTGVSPDLVGLLDGSSASADIVTAAQVMSIAFNTSIEGTPIADAAVRQALNHAVDRQAIVDHLLLGQGNPATQGPTPGATGHNPDITGFEYDPELATQMLADAGYPDGFTLTADIVVGSFPADSEIYQLVKQNLADVGVEVELNQMQFSEWLEKYLANSWTSEMFGLSWNALPTMDAGRVMSNFSCLKNPAFFCDQPAADALSSAVILMDEDARTAAMQEVTAMMHENPPALYLVQQIDINGVSNELQGFSNDNRFFRFDLMSKA